MKTINCDVCGAACDIEPFSSTMPRGGAQFRLSDGRDTDLCGSCADAVRLQIETMSGARCG
jgi:hypothetical protein